MITGLPISKTKGLLGCIYQRMEILATMLETWLPHFSQNFTIIEYIEDETNYSIQGKS